MVNETNKPQQSLENEQLGQRLAASNQALADMQAEHRQLVEEMEQLRKRAQDLQRLREQQEREDEERLLEYQQNIEESSEISSSNEEANNVATTNSEEQQEETNEEGDPEEAGYIKEKLAEIARLKAQFKRVQHMINTTELIENHISKQETSTEKQQQQPPKEINKSKAKSENTAKPEITTPAVPTAAVTATDPDLITIPNMPSMADLNAATTSDEKEQLILTMLNMFQDFSSDLKSQADNLRAERERIKELKESIIRSRKEQNK